jgi:hypothetical protein
MENAILIKTKHGLVSIKVKDYSNDCVKNALAEYTFNDASKFICLASSMSYGIYGLKEKNKNFQIKKWTAPDFTDFAHTFTVQYIRTL